MGTHMMSRRALVPLQEKTFALKPAVWCDDLLSIGDLGPDGVRGILDLTGIVKARPAEFRGALAGKQFAMVDKTFFVNFKEIHHELEIDRLYRCCHCRFDRC